MMESVSLWGINLMTSINQSSFEATGLEQVSTSSFYCPLYEVNLLEGTFLMSLYGRFSFSACPYHPYLISIFKRLSVCIAIHCIKFWTDRQMGGMEEKLLSTLYNRHRNYIIHSSILYLEPKLNKLVII